MKKQLQSFRYALVGIGTAVRTEAHLRFHIVAAVYVSAFAAIAGFSAAKWAVLLLFIAAVLALEMINTAIESVCNLVTRDYHPLVKLAKDLAAGAVLTVAAAAAVTGVVFFFNSEVLGKTAEFFAAYPVALVPLCLSVPAAVWFVWKGPGRNNKTK